MKVGFTFDFKDDYLDMGFTSEESAEFDKKETIDGIAEVLTKLGYEVDKIGHIYNLTKKLSEGKRWDLVFNIAEGFYGFGRESQIPALLDAYKIHYTASEPLILALTLHKEMTKHIVRNFGFKTADFYLVEKEEDTEKVNIQFPLFVKPVAEGTGKGVNGKSVVYTKDELKEKCNEIIFKFNQGALVEEFLTGREFTVGIIGTENEAKVIAIMEIIVKKDTHEQIYSYDNKENYETIMEYKYNDEIEDRDLVEKCKRLALGVHKTLKCKDVSRVDIKVDKNGEPNFLEINPLPGLNPLHSDLCLMAYHSGLSYFDLIKSIVDSSLKRFQ